MRSTTTTLIVLFGVLAFFISAIYSNDSVCYTGVNLSCAEFAADKLPGVLDKDYTFPTHQEADYYTSKGMNLFRFPILWERLQPTLNGTFDGTYLGHVYDFVNYATGKGAYVVIDPHNYARYRGGVVGDNVPATALADLWSRLALGFKNNSKVFFGLMNEPNTMKTETWLLDANAAIAAIRQAGAPNLITVPGNAWTGASTWNQNWYGTPNGQVMTGIKDPNNHFVIEVHQYLDTDGSGTHDACVSATIGSERLQDFTTWARQHGYKAYLGEWAGGRNQVCYDAVTDLLKFLGANTDVFMGWTWWAGGPWWGEYLYTLDPLNGQDRPQMQYLTPHLSDGSHC